MERYKYEAPRRESRLRRFVGEVTRFSVITLVAGCSQPTIHKDTKQPDLGPYEMSEEEKSQVERMQEMTRLPECTKENAEEEHLKTCFSEAIVKREASEARKKRKIKEIE